jgi:hypothetical protein
MEGKILFNFSPAKRKEDKEKISGSFPPGERRIEKNGGRGIPRRE